MKRTIYLTILTIVTVFCVIFGSISHILGFFSHSVHPFWDNVRDILREDESKTEQTQTLSTDITEISMSLSVLSLTIREGNTFAIHYNCTDSLLPDITTEENRLIVTQPESNHLSSLLHQKCEMELTIPEGMEFDSIHIESDCGDLKFSDITSQGKFDVSASMGNIELDNCTAVDLTADCDMGNIELHDCTVTNLTLEENMGNITCRTTRFETLLAENNMGNVEADYYPGDHNYSLKLSADMGDVRIDGAKQSGDYTVKGEETYTVTLRTDMGSISLTSR